MKKIFAILLALSLLMMTAAASADAIRVWSLKGPTGMGMVKMMNDNDGTYEFQLAGSPDEVVSAIVSGNADIAAVPTNLAATLYQKTSGKIRLAALNTLGVLYIMEKGESITSVADLAGKTVVAAGQGSTPEYVLNYLLEAAGIADSVTVEYKSEHAEVVTLAATGAADVVLLPEPNVTTLLMKDAGFRIALDVTEAFDTASDHSATLSMGCVVVSTAFAAEHADELAAFMTAYEASVAFVNEQPADAAQMIEAQGIVPKAAIAARAIPNCHIVFIAGEEMKSSIAPFFEVLYNANPASVGGQLPDDAFYYIAD